MPVLQPLKQRYEQLRLALYHRRHGPGFRYHGVPVIVPDGLKFSFKRLLIQGKYEEPERRLIDRFIDPALPVLELGGALGIVSAYVGSRLKPETPCRIVEANPHIIEVCRTNANSARQGAKSEVVHAAIGYDGPSIRFEANPNVHVSRAADAQNAASPHMVEVATTTLAKEADALASIGPYTLIMDIEGMELDVFLHDAAALARCALAIVEIHPKLFAARGTSAQAFLDLVTAAGMKVAATDGNSLALIRA
ncbi:MAG: FkbM family methyltransferase [Rhizobiaceae bacterium]|nr:FkbM family methyltransferase [Rhizobiaceae bacterium]